MASISLAPYSVRISFLKSRFGDIRSWYSSFFWPNLFSTWRNSFWYNNCLNLSLKHVWFILYSTSVKQLIILLKIQFPNPYPSVSNWSEIFFQALLWSWKNNNLNYLRYMPLGYKVIRINVKTSLWGVISFFIGQICSSATALRDPISRFSS